MYSENMADACVYLMNLADDQIIPLLGQDCNDGLPPLVNISVGDDLTIAELVELVKRVRSCSTLCPMARQENLWMCPG